MESYVLPHLPPHLSCIHAALYTDVSGADALRQRLVAAAAAAGPAGEQERAAVDFAFIEARLVRRRSLRAGAGLTD